MWILGGNVEAIRKKLRELFWAQKITLGILFREQKMTLKRTLGMLLGNKKGPNGAY